MSDHDWLQDITYSSTATALELSNQPILDVPRTRPNDFLLIPIYNFDIESETPIVINDITIGFHEKKAVCFKRKEYVYSLPLPRIYFKVPKNNSENPRRILLKCLAIVKLFDNGMALANLILDGNENPIDYLPHYELWKRDGFTQEILITNDKLNSFKEFLNENYNKIESNIDNFALTRFILADHEPYNVDMFVKLVECLECIYVPDSNKGEISYKFALRASNILSRLNIADSESENDAVKFFEILKKYMNVDQKLPMYQRKEAVTLMRK